MLYMVTFTINIPPMLAYIPYMDPMGDEENPSKMPCLSIGKSVWKHLRADPRDCKIHNSSNQALFASHDHIIIMFFFLNDVEQ